MRLDLLRPNTARPLPALRRAALAGALGVLAACGGSSGGGGGGTSGGQLDLLLTDAPSDELLSFTLTVDSLRLLTAGGSTENLLSAPLDVELLGLAGGQRWVLREDSLPEGTYTGVRVGFVPASIVALDPQGAEVAVNAPSASLEVALAQPVSVTSSTDLQLLVDFDMAGSLLGNIASPPLVFAPQGSVVVQDTSSSVGIDEIRGTVQSVGNGELVLEAYADGDLSVPLGDVDVTVGGSTLLLDDDGAQLDQVAFFAALVPGATVLEVHGALLSGAVAATRIEIEDQQGNGVEDRVKIEGRIQDLDSGSSSFDLLIIEIEKGADLVAPVLSNLGNPSAIPVVWDGGTVFLLDEDQVTTSAALSEGARVEVKFSTFTTSPFTALRIELEDGPEFEGTVIDDSGLPGSIVIRLDSDEPAIAAGQVQNSSTPVTVELEGTDVFLGVDGKPDLTVDQILEGMKVEAQNATISGPPTAPTITAGRLKVFAGRFDGRVTATAPGLSSFDAAIEDLDDSFGSNVGPGPVTVLITENTTFDDEATSAASFFALFSGLAQGEELEVRVLGIGTGFADEIEAYEIEAEVRD